MARKTASPEQKRLTTTEIVVGWLYLPIYLVALNVLLNLANRKLSLGMGDIGLNIASFSINLLAVCLIFRRFLRQKFFGESFWDFIQAVILGFVLYYVVTLAVRFLITKLSGELTLYNNDTVNGLVAQNRYVMLVIAVIVAPIVEETLIRGLVFGSLRSASRPLAYVISCLIFSLMHNWQYFGSHPTGAVLLSCLAYLPASAALAWTYEKSGTIWAGITMHALINAAAFGLLPFVI